MWRNTYVATLLVAILFCQAQAAVVRIDAASNVIVQKPDSSAPQTTLVDKPANNANAKDNKTEQPETTTLKIVVADEEVPLVPLSRDEDASIKIGGGLIDPPTDTTDEVRHSEVLEFPQVAIATLDPAPGTLEELEVVLEEQLEDDEPNTSAELKKQIQKSSKLLLLSTPKRTEKPREQEENIEELEEFEVEETTDKLEESTTIQTVETESKQTTEQSVTKLVPVNEQESTEKPKEQAKGKESTKPNKSDESKESEESDETKDSKKTENNKTTDESKSNESKSDESKSDESNSAEQSAESKNETQSKTDSKKTKNDDASKKSEQPQPSDKANDVQNNEKAKDTKQAEALKSTAESEPLDDTPKSDDTTASATELAAQPLNDNIATSVLIETEAEYVLLDTDFAEEYGTFTHIDSDVHLQPIVQSVEIVPTSVDGDLIVNYVHAW